MIVSTANGSPMQATGKVELLLNQLNQQAKQATVILDLKAEALLDICQLADSGYTTIFHLHNQGITVHDVNSPQIATDKPALLQGWRNTGRLWMVPLRGNNSITPSHKIKETAMNVYKLPMT